MLRCAAFAAVLWPVISAKCVDDCDASQEREDDSMLQLHHKGDSKCTAKHADPFATSSRVECCEGLEMCLGHFGGGWSYRCFASCTGTCTLRGDNPYASGTFLECCPGLQPCDGDWNMDGSWSQKCHNKCDMGEYHPYFDTTPDYLNIAAGAAGVKGNPGKKSDNYYLVIGDNGGCAGGCNGCCGWQKQVAAKMKSYVTDRKTRNPNSKLLFIILVGDNFYWNGVSDNRFELTWKDIYEELATDYPWFVILGNHDFGNADPACLCPFFNPRMTCSGIGSGCGGAAPFSNKSQTYACNQLNVDKGGIGGNTRTNFHIPDFMFFYTIPDLDSEMIGMEYNYDFNNLGGNGYGQGGGARDVAKACGGTERVHDSLARLRDASNKILKIRADAAVSTNVAIFGHYPDWAQDGINLRKKFLDEVSNQQRPGKRVLNFYGHTHIQQCDRHAEEGYDGCTDFLTGGAGGCCGDTTAGFTAITFGDDGKQITECFVDEPCTIAHWPTLVQANVSVESHHQAQDDVCPHTVDDPRCPAYKGPIKL